MRRFITLILLCVTAAVYPQEPPKSALPNGLLARFSQGGKEDSLVLPNAALFISRSESPTTFLEPGPFTVELEGRISVELRAQYTFRALVSGTLELIINGAQVLNFTGTDITSEPSKPVRLNRGTNSIVARFTSPISGDARFQIFWSSKNWPEAIPIPTGVISFDSANAALLTSSQLRSGIAFLEEYRCLKCHAPETNPSPEMQMDAPDFEDIGSRLNANWIAEWIADPARESPNARMPRIFSGDQRKVMASAIAAYLSTLQNRVMQGDRAGNNGEEFFKSLNCGSCHSDSDHPLTNVRRKFKTGALLAYLQKPEAHFNWSAMPNFHLTSDEANALSAFLNSKATPSENGASSASAEEGKVLLQTSGCLNCHKSKLENRSSAPSLATVAKSPLQGCLGDEPSGRAPRFNLRQKEKETLTAFLKNGNFSPLSKPVPYEFALHQLENLRCTECHEKIEGLPRISLVGSKLKPEWTERFIQGEIPYKPRPWLQARMPAFPAYATNLARGLAALHGNPPTTPSDPPIDPQLASTGAKLVSAAGGFSCVACHAIGSFSSGQVVESPGVNLAYTGERLLKPFFRRWVINPAVIDPATKMPVYFDAQGRSQLTDILDGDAQKQIDAIWEYARLGSKMPPPPLP